MNKVVKLNNVSKNFGKSEILKNCNMSVNEGSFHGFVGENGAGKTTTLNIISGTLPNFKGQVYINNTDIKKIKKQISLLFIPERIIFPNHLNAFQYIKHFVELFTDFTPSKKEIEDLFIYFGIKDRIKTWVWHLRWIKMNITLYLRAFFEKIIKL